MQGVVERRLAVVVEAMSVVLWVSERVRTSSVSAVWARTAWPARSYQLTETFFTSVPALAPETT